MSERPRIHVPGRLEDSFTVATVAMRWRVSEEVAQEFLEDFAARGLVAPVAKLTLGTMVHEVPDRWRVTERGNRISSGLLLWEPSQHVDHSRPARHRRRVLVR